LDIFSIFFSRRKYDKEAITKVRMNFKIKDMYGGKFEYHLKNRNTGICHKYKPYDIEPI
jgi:hypothetical protein